MLIAGSGMPRVSRLAHAAASDGRRVGWHALRVRRGSLGWGSRRGSTILPELVPIRVLIVDDHSVVRSGLRMFLGLDLELEVVGEAEDGQQALELATRLRPDVVLMDLLMPRMDGVAATAAIRCRRPRSSP